MKEDKNLKNRAVIFLTGIIVGVGLVILLLVASIAISHTAMGITERDKIYLNLAYDQAENAIPEAVPVGAVIVINGTVVASAHNDENYPYEHAEIIAIQEALKKLNASSFEGMAATIYVTYEPCKRCEAEITMTKIQRTVYAKRKPLINSINWEIIDMLNYRLNTRGGINEMLQEQLFELYYLNKSA